MTIGQYILYSILGIAVVFVALALLMLIVKIISRIPETSGKKAVDAGSDTAAGTVSASIASVADGGSCAVRATEAAPGSAGELKLYGTDPRDAAMIMAIVADEMGVPLNELRFLSIKEVVK